MECICLSVGRELESEKERRRSFGFFWSLRGEDGLGFVRKSPCSASSCCLNEEVRRLRSCFDSRGFKGSGGCILNLLRLGIGRKRRLCDGRNIVAANGPQATARAEAYRCVDGPGSSWDIVWSGGEGVQALDSDGASEARRPEVILAVGCVRVSVKKRWQIAGRPCGWLLEMLDGAAVHQRLDVGILQFYT